MRLREVNWPARGHTANKLESYTQDWVVSNNLHCQSSILYVYLFLLVLFKFWSMFCLSLGETQTREMVSTLKNKKPKSYRQILISETGWGIQKLGVQGPYEERLDVIP